MIKAKFIATGAALSVAALLLAGCSAGGGTGSDANSNLSQEAQAALKTAFTGIGGTVAVEPIKNIPANENVYVVSCGEMIPGCSVPAAAVASAAKAIGWKATIADGKLNPEGFATAIRQGIAGGATVIVPIGIGCGVAQAAFQEAVTAGIKIIGGGGPDDCKPKLWASERKWITGSEGPAMWGAFGALQADYLFGKTNGNANPVVINFSGQVWGQWITDGFNAELKKLGNKGKVLQTVDVADPEVGDGSFVQKITTALLKNPEANSLVLPIDAWISGGLGQAIVQSGTADKLIVVSRGGDAAVLDMIRTGGQGVTATVGSAIEWGAWGSIDTAARVLSGGEGVDIAESAQAIDADNNLPKSGSYKGSIDWQAAFLKAWGK